MFWRSYVSCSVKKRFYVNLLVCCFINELHNILFYVLLRYGNAFSLAASSETLSGPRPFLFSLRASLQPGLCINNVQLWPRWALPLMQRWLCVFLCLSHGTLRGLHHLLLDLNCQSCWEKCQETHSSFYSPAVVLLVVMTRLPMQRWNNGTSPTYKWANQPQSLCFALLKNYLK